MKLAKEHAYISPGAIWSMLLPSENKALFQVQPMACKLFLALLHCIDFKTGKGQTGYPSLISVMTPPYSGKGRRPAAPTRDDIKNALRELEAVGLISRDTALSEDKKALFFSVQKRDWETASAELSTRYLTRRENGANPDEQRAKRPRRATSYPTSYPRIQGSRNKTLPLNVDKLSTGDEGANRTAQGEKIGPPRGADMGPGGPTPPPEALTGTGDGVRQGMELAPPGGLSVAPTGRAPKRQAVPPPEQWERDEQGRVKPPTNVKLFMLRQRLHRERRPDTKADFIDLNTCLDGTK